MRVSFPTIDYACSHSPVVSVRLVSFINGAKLSAAVGLSHAKLLTFRLPSVAHLVLFPRLALLLLLTAGEHSKSCPKFNEM